MTHAVSPRDTAHHSRQTTGFTAQVSRSPVSKTAPVQIGVPIWSHQRRINELRRVRDN
jgi:hypothetical protein